MSEPIAFYFDFGSPYGYFGSLAVEPVAARLRRQVVWRPVLLGITVLKVMGLKALPDTPLKGDYVRHDVKRIARMIGVPFNPCPVPMQPLAAMRAFVWLDQQDPGLAQRFGQAVYRAQWAEATDMSSPNAVASLVASLGADPAPLQTDAVKQALRRRVDDAIAAGVFGVPTFIVDGEMFWGTDRLPMLERWVETGGW
jgi:2-hydroxychromene-2-carboxylate isomerase